MYANRHTNAAIENNKHTVSLYTNKHTNAAIENNKHTVS